MPASEFAGGKHTHTPGMALPKQKDPIIIFPHLFSQGDLVGVRFVCQLHRLLLLSTDGLSRVDLEPKSADTL